MVTSIHERIESLVELFTQYFILFVPCGTQGNNNLSPIIPKSFASLTQAMTVWRQEVLALQVFFFAAQMTWTPLSSRAWCGSCSHAMLALGPSKLPFTLLTCCGGVLLEAVILPVGLLQSTEESMVKVLCFCCQIQFLNSSLFTIHVCKYSM